MGGGQIDLRACSTCVSSAEWSVNYVIVRYVSARARPAVPIYATILLGGTASSPRRSCPMSRRTSSEEQPVLNR